MGITSDHDEHNEYGVLYDNLWLKCNLPVCIIIVIANFVALVVFLRRSFLIKKSTYLLVNLTIADLLVGLVLLLVSLCANTNECKLFSTPNAIITADILPLLVRSASVFTLSFIAVERTVAVFWPFHHRLAKRWHYFTAIGFVWLLATTRAVLYAFFYSIIKFKMRAITIVNITMTFNLVMIVCSYVSIWIKLTFFTKFRRCRTIQENSKLTKTLFIMTVVSIATLSPLMSADAALFYGGIQVFSTPIVFPILFAILLCNSFLNVVVYWFRMPEFRKGLRNIFCEIF